mmetsp:Transcript_16757/g.19196  ORF Transcript_16757/g.19196 Transcript_16757/m.19196 type:complete len:128 (+) Transcript_16757:2-385(+)
MTLDELSKYIHKMMDSAIPPGLLEIQRSFQSLHKIRHEGQQVLNRVMQESRKLEAEQETLKIEFRTKLLEEASEKDKLERKILDLEESISEVKSNLRLKQQVQNAGGISGTMAVLGSGRPRNAKHRR